jgi:threonyl-tRNA synthetase
MLENSKLNITFPDGSKKEFKSGIMPIEIAEGISHSLAKKTLAAKIDDKVVALNHPIKENASLQLLTFDDNEGRDLFWHSSAHLMAQAVKRLYPEAQLGIGPPIDDGFYYDIDLDKKLSPEDFDAIENEMNKIVDQDLKVERHEFANNDEAIKFFKEKNENLKIELIQEFEEEISAYSQGEFTDLCRGPHIPSTGKLGKNFKLLSVAGAYWRGDEKNKQLQRIYGTNYPDKKMLKQHLFRIEEAKKRDHRKLGKELDLFSIQDDIGGGLILWHPKGAFVRNEIEKFWKDEHYKNGYQLVYTPHVAKLNLWETSGHTNFYQENMYSPIAVEEVDYQLKPMNCPFHMTIYNSHLRSYRDLPMRYAELGTVYRYERSGVLHGLMRVRGFTQDDAHIYCLPENLKEEIIRVIDFTVFMLESFGFKEYDVYLSTRPEKYVGSIENWDDATESLRAALEAKSMKYEIDPGEGVFYGPKIDIKIKDVLGRSWQCSTIQVDFNLPERFDIKYVGEDGTYHRPIVIHRALLGSLERFFGVMIEHYAGNFPLWLAPVQVKILPIADRHLDKANEIADNLAKHMIRYEIDSRSEKVNYKIREAEVQKINYMLIIGDKEIESNNISLRKKGEGNVGNISLTDLVEMINMQVKNKN